MLFKSTAPFSSIVLAGLTCVISTAFPTHSLAQQRPAQTPLKPDQLLTHVRIAAVSTCNLAKAKVSFDTAVGANGAAIATYTMEIHGGRIEGINQALQSNQVFSAVTTDIALIAFEICKDVIPQESQKKIEELKKATQR